MKSPKTLLVYGLLVLVIILIFSVPYACSSGSSNRFVELLGLVPDRDVTYIILIDYEKFNEIAGIDLADLDQPVTLMDYWDVLQDNVPSGLFPRGSDITGYGRYAMELPIHEYLGYSLADVQAEIQAGRPPANVVGAIGTFNPGAVAEALSHQEDWPDWVKEAYETDDYHGITIHSWGDGMEMNIRSRLVPPIVDELGRARPLAISDRYLFYAGRISDVEWMIDASQDREDSLADVPDYAAAASALYDQGVYMAIIGDESMVNVYPEHLELTPEEQELLEERSGPRLAAFNIFGSGDGWDEDGPYMVLVLVHDNADDAGENASLLRKRIRKTNSLYLNRPWDEIITDIDITVEGNVLVAKLYVDTWRLGISWVNVQDNLLLHD